MSALARQMRSSRREDPASAWPSVELPWRGVDRTGEALELRLAEERDATAWIDHLARITTETPWMLQCQDDPLPTTLEQRSLLQEYEARDNSIAIVAVRPGQRVIRGSLTLAGGRSRRTEHAAELSMGIGSAWRGRGIGTLLMGASLTWASQRSVLRRVSLSVFQDNDVARRLYERVGFVTEGVLRRYVRRDWGYDDLVVMALWLGGEG